MSWKSWTAGTLGTAAIIGALAFANIAAAGSGAANPEIPAAPTQPVQVVEQGAIGSDPLAPTTSPSPATDPGPLPFCGGYAMPVPEGVQPGDPIPTPAGFDPDYRCFATAQEVQEHYDPQP